MKSKAPNINRIIKTKLFSNKQNNLSRLLRSKKSYIQKRFMVKDISLQNINNKNRDSITNKILKTSKSISYPKSANNNKLKIILQTSDVMNRAEMTALYLKSSIIDSDKKYIINKKRFERIRKQTNDINKFYSCLKEKEKKEEEKTLINNNKNDMSDDSTKENNNTVGKSHKLFSILNDNPLLITRKKDIESYYLHKNKNQVFKDSKKLRYMDKLNELLEVIKIRKDKLIDKKEKFLKIQNTKYFSNYKSRINQEQLDKEKIMLEQIKKENEISLKNIEETNNTLNTINHNKTFLDDEIELKFKHINSNSNSNTNINNKTKNTFYSTKRSNKSKEKEINNDDSFKSNNFHILRINKILSEVNELPQIKTINKSNSSLYYNREKRKKFMQKLHLINDNESLDNENNYTKYIIGSLYEEIKDNNILNKENREYVEDYFKKKNFYLNDKPHQVISIITNSLHNLKYLNIEKECKKVYGLYYPSNIVKHFDDLNSIDKNANRLRAKLVNSLCKYRLKKNKDENNKEDEKKNKDEKNIKIKKNIEEK